MLTTNFEVISNSYRCLESNVFKFNKNIKKKQRNKIEL